MKGKPESMPLRRKTASLKPWRAIMPRELRIFRKPRQEAQEAQEVQERRKQRSSDKSQRGSENSSEGVASEGGQSFAGSTVVASDDDAGQITYKMATLGTVAESESLRESLEQVE
jgi:hypothetical protein